MRNALRRWRERFPDFGGFPMSSCKSLTPFHFYETPSDYAEAWNFGPNDDDVKPVDWILDRMAAKWGEGASWQLDDGEHPHEAGFLKLDISKAISRLQWWPTWHLEQTLEKIIHWHQAWLNHADMQAACLSEINQYMQDKKA